MLETIEGDNFGSATKPESRCSFNSMQICVTCRNDISGARDAGCFAWLWGLDVLTFDEVSRKLLHEEDEENPEAILSPLS